MATLVPVNYDPFKQDNNGYKTPKLVPVDGDPFLPDENMMPAHSPQLRAAHTNTTAPQQNIVDATMRESTRILSPVYRPVLEGGGAGLGAIGGMVGTGGNPLGGVFGGSLGYASGKGMADTLDMYAGIKEPYQSPGNMIKQTGQDLLTGAELEAGGQIVGAALYPVFRGGKWVFLKAKDLAKAPFSRQAVEKAAGEVLQANTSMGTIYAQNAEQALELQKEIPGLKFTVGQQTNDPALIKLERAQIRQSGEGANINKQQIASNNEALRTYYEKNFGDAGSLDDVYKSLSGRQNDLQTNAARLQDSAQSRAYELGPQNRQNTGQNILNTIEDAKAPIKDAMNELEKAIPDYPMRLDNANKAIQEQLASKKLSKAQRGAIESASKDIQDIIEGDSITTHSAIGIRRTLNDSISKAFMEGENSKAVALLKIRDGVEADLAEVAAQARTGKIAEYHGRTVRPDELAQQYESNLTDIARLKTADQQPDIDAMVKEMMADKNSASGPLMQQVKESDKGYAERMISEYQRRTGKSPLMKENQYKSSMVQTLESKNKNIQEVLQNISPGQDVAASMKAFNDFASTEYFSRFGKGATEQVTAKGNQYTGKRLKLEDIPKYFTSETGADDLIRAIGQDNAKEIMRGHYAYDMMKNATDGASKINYKALQNWNKNNYRALKKYGLTDDFKSIESAQKIADDALLASQEFEKSAAARILKSDPQTAISKAISANNPGRAAADLRKIVGNDKAALNGLRNSFADHIMKQIMTTAEDIAGNPTVSKASFKKLMIKYEPAMQVLYKDAPEKLKAMHQMRQAYEIMSRNTTSPVGGGSDTAENLLTVLSNNQTIKDKILPRSLNFIRGIWSAVSKYNKQQIDDIVTRSLFDPEYADLLKNMAQKRIEPGRLDLIMNGKVVRIDDYRRRQTQRLGAALSGAAAGGQ